MSNKANFARSRFASANAFLMQVLRKQGMTKEQFVKLGTGMAMNLKDELIALSGDSSIKVTFSPKWNKE